MTVLKIAIQKSGRLKDDSINLLKECGISINNSNNQLMAQASNFQLEVLYLRNSDIPGYVKDGVADIAIIGENTEIEKQTGINKLIPLGFSKCKVSIAVPKEVDFTGVEWLNSKSIATSYPNTLKAFLKENNIVAKIHEISGSVEIAPNVGIADCICDIVSTGSTLFKNGLKEVYQILESEAILVSNQNLSEEKKEILQRLIFRIKSVLSASNTKYVMLNAKKESLETICNLLPGIKSPTIMPLKEEGWYSVHSVINENKFWSVIDELGKAGAQGILVIPIEKIINFNDRYSKI